MQTSRWKRVHDLAEHFRQRRDIVRQIGGRRHLRAADQHRPLAAQVAGVLIDGGAIDLIDEGLDERVWFRDGSATDMELDRDVVLQQDDYFRLPPKSNHQKRLDDILWVGTGEVRLDLSESVRSHIWRTLARFSST